MGKPAAEKTTREFRLPLDGQSVYFLRFFWENGEWNRISIDKELANDSHYMLSAQAAKQLEAELQWGFETLDLVALLRRFFKTKSDYALTGLMYKNGIPYQAFHY